ncbi:MAG TPA: hypothetical protein VI142_07800 [Gaiellaceae bacterium]
MQGYEVIASDDHKLGHVVEVEEDNLIVEHGLLVKKRHAVPKVLAHPDESEQVVRLSVSRELVDASPKVDDGQVDRRAVAEHYGLAAGEPAPETEGYGEVLPDDPAWSAEQQELRTGVEPAARRRARIREGESDAGPHGRPPAIPPDPHEGP